MVTERFDWWCIPRTSFCRICVLLCVIFRASQWFANIAFDKIIAVCAFVCSPPACLPAFLLRLNHSNPIQSPCVFNAFPLCIAVGIDVSCTFTHHHHHHHITHSSRPHLNPTGVRKPSTGTLSPGSLSHQQPSAQEHLLLRHSSQSRPANKKGLVPIGAPSCQESSSSQSFRNFSNQFTALPWSRRPCFYLNTVHNSSRLPTEYYFTSGFARKCPKNDTNLLARINTFVE